MIFVQTAEIGWRKIFRITNLSGASPEQSIPWKIGDNLFYKFLNSADCLSSLTALINSGFSMSLWQFTSTKLSMIASKNWLWETICFSLSLSFSLSLDF